MLTIVIGILIAFGVLILEIIFDGTGMGGELAAMLASVIMATSLVIAIFIPTKYGEWELIKETELVSLSKSTEIEGGEIIYVNRSAEYVYTYCYEISPEFGTETSTDYETDTISENVIESEDKNCEIPVLREYRRKGKITIWTFGFGSEEKYDFYVPEGTIQRDTKLK